MKKIDGVYSPWNSLTCFCIIKTLPWKVEFWTSHLQAAHYYHFWGWVCGWIEENLAESLVPINPSYMSLFLCNHEAEDVVDRQVKPFRTRGLKESGWHLALFSKGANSVGRTDVSRLASDAQRSDEINQNVLWIYSTPCLFSPQKLVFADKYGVGPSWLPATWGRAEALGDSVMWG